MSFWHRLDLRLALAVLLGLAASGGALVAWQSHAGRTAADAQWQAQSLGLARYVVQRHALRLSDGYAARRADTLADIGMYIAMIHPSLEAYLLAPDGTIISHTLPAPGPARQRVDLSPVRALLQEGGGEAPAALPVYGQDPRLPEGLNLVSVAPVGQGAWLYLVLRGEQATGVAEQSSEQARQLAWWAVLGASLLLGGGMTMVLQRQVTRRLSRLAGELAAFRPGTEAPPSAEPSGDEIDQLARDARALQQRVQQQIRQLEDSDRQRRELISNISHDLHTPLANIRGWLDTLLLSGERLSAAERERHLRTAARHCAGLGRRVTELFELANLESARTVAHPEPFCMAELVSDVVQTHQLDAEQRGIHLGLAQDADREAAVWADIGLIERVLNNLVQNALRHTARGGQIELTVCAEGDQVMVKVADNGRGIAPADLPHVFERYWTTRSTAAEQSLPPAPATPTAVPAAHAAPALEAHRPAVTAGLGLAIARRIVELHGGSISVRPGEPQGCEFTFSLPAGRPAA